MSRWAHAAPYRRPAPTYRGSCPSMAKAKLSQNRFPPDASHELIASGS